MGGTLNGTLQKKREEKEFLNESKSIEMTIEDFNKLETWDAPQWGLDMAREAYFHHKLIPAQNEVYDRMRERMGLRNAEENVRTVVPVETPPVQQMPVTQESSKARRKRLKKEKEVTSRCPSSVNKEETYDLSHDIKSNLQAHRNSVNEDVAKRCRRAYPLTADQDYHTLLAFCNGYRTNVLGFAANREESEKKEADQDFINTYFASDENPQMMYPYLDILVENLMRTSITRDMFSKENFRRRGPELRGLRDRIIGMERLRTKYPGYFEALPQLKLDMLDAMQELLPQFNKTLECSLRERGINCADGEYNSEEITENEAVEIGNSKFMFENSYEAFQARKESAIEAEVNRRNEEAEADIYEDFDSKIDVEQNVGPGQEFERFAGIHLTNRGSTYDYDDIAYARKLITEHPSEYAANKEIVDTVYQELYKAIDLRADNYIKKKTLTYVLDGIDKYSTDMMEIEMRYAYDKHIELAVEEGNLLEARARSLKEILLYVLNKKVLSGAAAATLEQMGIPADSIVLDINKDKNEEGGNQ